MPLVPALVSSNGVPGVLTLALMRQSGEFTHEYASGMSVIDDTQMLLASKWGPTILGPQGEVRIVATKR